MDPSLIPMLIAIIACVIMSGYFSATETAFSSFNKTKMKTIAEKGNKKAKLVLKLADDYNTLISTILIGNNVVNIAAASVSTILFTALLSGDEGKGSVVSTVVLTIVILIFGEVSPKSIAKDIPEKFTMFSAPFIQLLIWVFTPFNFLFGLWKKLLRLIIKSDDDGKMSQEELLMFVEEVEQGGSIDEEEGDLLRNVIEINEKTAADILTHRVDVVALPLDSTKEEIAALLSETKFSRIPVYDTTIDNVVGILHQKDFYTGSGITDQALSELITPPLYIPKSETANDILKTFKQEQSHIAIVVDEYGGTVGIVTMEDVLEEIVGDIWDEHDEVVEEFSELEDGKFKVSCDMNIDDFCEQFGIEIETESTTVNGWVTEMLDKIAEEGDSFTYANLEISVTETESNKAEFVSVTVNAPEGEEEAPAVAEQD
jgi:CBS domain containing-hemolysin-like protein